MQNVLDRFRLDGKRAFITGGSRGFGRVIALALAEAGADVALDGARRRLRSPGRQAKSRSAGGRPGPTPPMWPIRRVRGALRARAAEIGPIDILVNNVAGGSRTCRSRRRASRRGRPSSISTSRTSSSAPGRSAARCWRAAQGRVINIASISGMIANRGIAGRHYETTKAAVIHFTRATAADWAPRGVTVNAICPGLFMTEPERRLGEEAPRGDRDLRQRRADGPRRRAARDRTSRRLPASPASSYVTGAAFVIDGGYTLW